jgi:hypothetical protein
MSDVFVNFYNKETKKRINYTVDVPSGQISLSMGFDKTKDKQTLVIDTGDKVFKITPIADKLGRLSVRIASNASEEIHSL